MENKKVKERLLMLNVFCKEICKRPHLYSSKEFQTFLRTPMPIEKALKALPNEPILEIIQKYHEKFQALSGKEINSDLIMKSATF